MKNRNTRWWEWPLGLVLLIGLGVAIIAFRTPNPANSHAVRPAGCYRQHVTLNANAWVVAYYPDAQRHPVPGTPTKCPFRFPPTTNNPQGGNTK